MLMQCLRARLAETLMSIGDQSYARIFTVDQTHFAEVVGCPCCGNFRRNCSILWLCLIGRLCIILVCVVVVVIGVSSKMVIQRCGVGAYAVTHGVQELHRCIRAAVIAIDAVFDARVVRKTPLCFRATDTLASVKTSDVCLIVHGHSRTCLHRVCLLLNVELDRMQTVESESEFPKPTTVSSYHISVDLTYSR